MNEPIKSADDFLQGQRDCQSGIESKPGQSPDYYRGYSVQYHIEQIVTELSIQTGTMRRASHGFK